MRKKKPSSRKGERRKTWYLIILLIGLATLLFAPKVTIAEPHHIERAGIFWIYSAPSEEDQIKRYIVKTFHEQPQIALAVFTAESHLNTCTEGDKNNRKAPEGSWGIAQINKSVHKELIGDRDLCNWKDNIDIAREIWEESGWKPWSAYNSDVFRRYIK
ncbi:MAG: hypothetical protein WAW92_04560 [Minisyncoccia bacterium]